MNEGYLEENVKWLKDCHKMMAWAHVMYLKSKGQQGINALHVLIDLEKENLEKVKDSKGIEEIPGIQKGGKSKVLKWRLCRIRHLKRKRELPPTTTGNPENKCKYFVRAQYSTDRKREASWQQAKERINKMIEQRKLTVRISNYTKTSKFSELYKLIEEAEKEAEERKLDAEINIAIELSSNKGAN